MLRKIKSLTVVVTLNILYCIVGMMNTMKKKIVLEECISQVATKPVGGDSNEGLTDLVT